MGHKMNDMLHMQLTEHAQSVVAKTATAASVGGAGVSIVAANEIIQLIAGVVAIVAGIGAAWWHFERIYDTHDERKRRRRDNNSGGPKGKGNSG